MATRSDPIFFLALGIRSPLSTVFTIFMRNRNRLYTDHGTSHAPPRNELYLDALDALRREIAPVNHQIVVWSIDPNSITSYRPPWIRRLEILMTE